MLNSQQQPAKAAAGPADNSVYWLYFVLQTWAMSVEVFLHRRFGSRYNPLPAAAVLLLVPLYCAAWQGQDVRPMWQFLEAYVSACFIARINIVCRHWRGDRIHTRYSGEPRLCLLLPRMSEIRIKQFLEPLVVFLVGVGMCKYSQLLGGYLIVAALCLFCSVAQTEAYYRRRATDIYDSVIEQQSIAERFRNLRGET